MKNELCIKLNDEDFSPQYECMANGTAQASQRMPHILARARCHMLVHESWVVAKDKLQELKVVAVVVQIVVVGMILYYK